MEKSGRRRKRRSLLLGGLRDGLIRRWSHLGRREEKGFKFFGSVRQWITAQASCLLREVLPGRSTFLFQVSRPLVVRLRAFRLPTDLTPERTVSLAYFVRDRRTTPTQVAHGNKGRHVASAARTFQ